MTLSHTINLLCLAIKVSMKRDSYRIYHKFGQSLILSSKLFTKVSINDSYVLVEGEIIWQDWCKAKFTWEKGKNKSLIVLTYLYIGQDSECLSISQEIDIHYQPSNLGKGEIFFFVCPFTKKRCRTLILTGNSKHFRHRSGYKNLYYKSQIRSKRQRVLYRYHDLKDQITELESVKFKRKYKGKSTRKFRRLANLRLLERKYNRARQSMFATFLSKRQLA